MGLSRRNFLKYFGALAGVGSLAGASGLVVAAPKASNKPAYVNDMYKHRLLASDSADPVAVQLVLAMDTSGSMDESEYQLQKMATANAINSELFRNLIKYKSGENSIAISVVEFDNQGYIRVPWVDVRGAEISSKPYIEGDRMASSYKPDVMDALANEILTLSRINYQGTDITKGMMMAGVLFDNCPWTVSERRVLDIMGDGKSLGTINNSIYGYNYNAVRQMSDLLGQKGITINGFALANEIDDLDEYFERYVVTQKSFLASDGLRSEPGRVWKMAGYDDQTNDYIKRSGSLKAYYNEVLKGMKQKVSVEFAGKENYQQHAHRLKDNSLGHSIPRMVFVNR